MISELTAEFLVCALVSQRFMQQPRRWLVRLSLCALAFSAGNAALAQEPDYTDVNAYILQAEMALQREDYLMAVQEYGKVAVFEDLYGNLWDLIEYSEGHAFAPGS